MTFARIFLNMLLVKYIRENREEVINGLLKRSYNQDQLALIDQAIQSDDSRKQIQTDLDAVLSQINKISKEIGLLYKEGKREEAELSKRKVNDLKERSKSLEEQQRQIRNALEDILLAIPNVPHESVKAGKSEVDNEVVFSSSAKLPILASGALPHWELASTYNLIDFPLGTKIAGSGFPLYRGKGAKLQRALISFFLDEAIAAGYEEIIPPLLVNEHSAKATGQIPDKEGQMYHMEKDNLFLIPTAEVPITNIYRNNILSESDLPIRLTGHTPCFRREAGSYGSDVKGLNRVHQFDKVEIVQITHPDDSYNTLVEMVDHVKNLMHKLELPYRILRLCGGDLGFTSALTYDFEVYSAGQEKWLEVSSVSNFETFQSNRLKLRYKDNSGKKHLTHTLNGSALALARIVAALLENNQEKDKINIPEVLVPYTGFDCITV